MKALDTNVVARFILNDDPRQSASAAEQLKQPCFIPDTVLLECAWLLSSRFGVRRADLAATLRDLISIPSVGVSNHELVVWALERFAAGADFADMLHLAAARATEAFVTFERRLDRQAGPDAPVKVEVLR